MRYISVTMLAFLALLLLGAGIWHFSANSNDNGHLFQDSFELNAGTPFATTVTRIESGQPGPSLLIVGGIHGNEPAGVQAVEELLQSLAPLRGRVVLLPVANPPALAAEMRFISTESDLNRAFGPGGTVAPGTEDQAQALWDLLIEEEINWVVDLHEAQDFYRRDETKVGQTLIFPPAPEAADLVLRVLEGVNNQLEPELSFTYLSPPPPGSLVQEAWGQLGIPGIIVETSNQQELAARVAQHRLVVKVVVGELLGF